MRDRPFGAADDAPSLSVPNVRGRCGYVADALVCNAIRYASVVYAQANTRLVCRVCRVAKCLAMRQQKSASVRARAVRLALSLESPELPKVMLGKFINDL